MAEPGGVPGGVPGCAGPNRQPRLQESMTDTDCPSEDAVPACPGLSWAVLGCQTPFTGHGFSAQNFTIITKASLNLSAAAIFWLFCLPLRLTSFASLFAYLHPIP